MKTQRKSLPFELKAHADGEFRAVFATFNAIDHDGDVTIPGAFEAGKEVIVGSWGHKTAELPVGKGVIVVDEREAAVEGRFFLDTAAGRDTYQTVKNLGELGEWSYVFTVTKQSFGEREGRQVRYIEGTNVYSVDPVLAGAGIGTRTTDIKSLPFLEHLDEFEEQVTAFVERVQARSAVRQKDGRGLSAASVERLRASAESLKSALSELEQLAVAGESKSTPELVTEFLRYQRMIAGLPA